MAKTPDRIPGVADQEGINFEESPDGLAGAEGRLRYSGGRFSLYDNLGEYDPRTGGGISEAEHQVLDTLVHEIDENSFDEVIRTDCKVSQVITWTNASKTLKIRERTITRDADGRWLSIVSKQYDGTGTLKETLTETVTRTARGKLASITRTRTTP